jgi:hypothetical protein
MTGKCFFLNRSLFFMIMKQRHLNHVVDCFETESQTANIPFLVELQEFLEYLGLPIRKSKH